MSALITYLGEALVDFLPVPRDGRTTGFEMHPGGSLLNSAVATARLGQRVALATKLSSDFFGRFLRAYAEAEHIDARWLLASPAPSTLAFVAMETGDPVFTFYGDGAADTLLEPGELPEEFFRETAVLHVGSISLLRGATPRAVLEACERLRGRALLSFDPNLRPAFVRDEAAYRVLLRRIIGLIDVIKVSAADLAWLSPGSDPLAAASALLAQGPSLVVVTGGATGVKAIRPGRNGVDTVVRRVPAFDVRVADTVGAGDSFTAGLLTRIVEGGVTSRDALEAFPSDRIDEALRFAAAVAALNCTRPGADPPDRASVEAFLADRLPARVQQSPAGSEA